MATLNRFKKPLDLSLAICLERAVLLAVLFYSGLFVFLSRLSVWGRMWNLIASVPDHCLFVYV